MSIGLLESALGHQFADRALLDQALTHSSYASEHPGSAFNERFEFLGDAVLQLAVTEFLFVTFPDLAEGQMAKIRAACVSGVALAEVAEVIGLGNHLRLGRGEESSGGREKASIQADAMEAVIAAVYLDAGYPVAAEVVLRLFEDRVRARAAEPGRMDYKTRLQELLASRSVRPDYVVNGTGPDHDRQFTAVVTVEGRELGTGSGRSKKEAEQVAAQRALEVIEAI